MHWKQKQPRDLSDARQKSRELTTPPESPNSKSSKLMVIGKPNYCLGVHTFFKYFLYRSRAGLKRGEGGEGGGGETDREGEGSEVSPWQAV